jgi:hypothetical protein
MLRIPGKARFTVLPVPKQRHRAIAYPASGATELFHLFRFGLQPLRMAVEKTHPGRNPIKGIVDQRFIMY